MTDPRPPRSDERDLEQQRRDADREQRRARAQANERRESRRALHDKTLHHARGTRQEHESLDRERQHDDADLSRERELHDALGERERSLTDEVLDQQAKALVQAGDSLRQGEAERLTRDKALHGLLQRALDEAARIDLAARSLLQEEPSGPGGVITERVASVRSAVERIEAALRQALDLR